jgi:two-component system response regulator HydG
MLGVQFAVNGYEVSGSNLLNVLLLDEDRIVRDSARDAVQTLGFNTLVADTAEHAYKQLEAQAVDIVLMDLRTPGLGGLDALRVIRSVRPDALVIITTAFATVASAVQAMRMGAFDYISKPFTTEELRLVLERAVEQLRTATEKRVLRERLRSKHGFGLIVGRSPEMEKLYRIISNA